VPNLQPGVVEFGEAAAELSALASVTPPPAGLRGSILSAISEVSPLPPEAVGQAPTAEWAAPLVTAEPGHPADELALRRPQRRTRLLSVLVAAVMVAAVALGGVVYTLVQSRQAQVAQQAAQQAAETELLTAPDVQTYSSTMKDGGQISFVVSRSLDRAMFIGNDLPTVGADGLISCGTSRVSALSRTTWWPVAAIVSSSSARHSVESPTWRSVWKLPAERSSQRRQPSRRSPNCPADRRCQWAVGGLPCA
jgi:Anti-sigma-K factor rskA